VSDPSAVQRDVAGRGPYRSTTESAVAAAIAVIRVGTGTTVYRGSFATRWLRPALLVALLAAAVGVAATVGVPPIEQVRTAVAAVGWGGPVLYVALYVGLSLTPAPATVLSVGAGVLFGLTVGVPVALTGALIGAVLGFGLARHLGRATVEGFGGERLARLDALLRRRGLLAMIGIRMVPIMPFAVINMACGLTGVRTRDYVLGTGVGVVPATTAFVAVGAYGADPASTPFLLAAAGLAVLVLGGAAVARRRHRAGRAV
jgi:uncharacterized membrane protein YdjX (TVP38/TMEM64 family)